MAEYRLGNASMGVWRKGTLCNVKFENHRCCLEIVMSGNWRPFKVYHCTAWKRTNLYLSNISKAAHLCMWRTHHNGVQRVKASFKVTTVCWLKITCCKLSQLKRTKLLLDCCHLQPPTVVCTFNDFPVLQLLFNISNDDHMNKLTILAWQVCVIRKLKINILDHPQSSVQTWNETMRLCHFIN